jgi:hypothetical protein
LSADLIIRAEFRAEPGQTVLFGPETGSDSPLSGHRAQGWVRPRRKRRLRSLSLNALDEHYFARAGAGVATGK